MYEMGKEKKSVNIFCTSFYPEMTGLLKEICDDIAKELIKEGQPIILIDEYSWYREVLSLMAKQINLCDSCLLLCTIVKRVDTFCCENCLRTVA